MINQNGKDKNNYILSHLFLILKFNMNVDIKNGRREERRRKEGRKRGRKGRGEGRKRRVKVFIFNFF